MAAFTNVVIFFAVLTLIYPAAAAVAALLAWLRKRRAGGSRELLERIDASTDRLKDRLFIFSVAAAFFVIAPFLVVWLIFSG